MREYKFGWIPDVPDFRDFTFSAPSRILSKLPNSVNLRNNKLPVFDQGSLGSCTAQSVSMAHMFNQYRQTKNFMIPSRLFIYYNERVMINTVNYDSGAYIRDGIKTLVKDGACEEIMWKYDISKFTIKPDSNCYKNALNHQAIQYFRVPQTVEQMTGCIASGYPFVFGFSVYDGFISNETANSGILNVPKQNERLLGGHAVLCCGFNMKQKRFLVQNSWGKNWGLPKMKGFFTIPFEYLENTDLSADMWTIRMVEI